MNWGSWSDFWQMGGYGLYVWGSFAMTIVCIAGEIWFLRRHRLQTMQRLKRMNAWETPT